MLYLRYSQRPVFRGHRARRAIEQADYHPCLKPGVRAGAFGDLGTLREAVQGAEATEDARFRIG
jgi:hypothetical protein